eukprot:SAG31_NODE_2109_length_6426_cov_13.928244_4_plen_111_part_00
MRPPIARQGAAWRRYHKSPSSGISVGRLIWRSCSRLLSDGESPAWTHRIFSSMMAAPSRRLREEKRQRSADARQTRGAQRGGDAPENGRWLNRSLNCFHSLIEYRFLHSS